MEQKKYRPRIKPERYSFFEPYTPAARIRLPLAARIRSPDTLTCNQTIQTIENSHLVANCLYIKALQQKPDNLTISTVFFVFIDTSSYFTTLMTRGATLLPSMRTRKTGALTSEREVRADVICRDERRRPAVLYTLRTAPTAFWLTRRVAVVRSYATSGAAWREWMALTWNSEDCYSPIRLLRYTSSAVYPRALTMFWSATSGLRPCWCSHSSGMPSPSVSVGTV